MIERERTEATLTLRRGDRDRGNWSAVDIAQDVVLADGQ
jgi:hypothetical protein